MNDRKRVYMAFIITLLVHAMGIRYVYAKTRYVEDIGRRVTEQLNTQCPSKP